MNKIYVVTVTHYDDKITKVLGAFKNEDDAKNYVRNDMEDYCDQHANSGIQVDFEQMEIFNEDVNTIHYWSIDEVEVQ